MKCTTFSYTYPLSEGIHDAYTAAIEAENLETRIILVSTRAFDELSEMKVPPVRYYRGNIGLGNDLFVDSRPGASRSTLTVTHLGPVRKALTSSYAQLHVQNGKCTLTVSPHTASSLRGEHFKIIYYKSKASFENKKEAVVLPDAAIYSFAEEEFEREYIDALHKRIQQTFSYAIFPQVKKKESNIFGKFKQLFTLKESDEDLSFYQPGLPYKIEERLIHKQYRAEKKFIGYSNSSEDFSDKTSSDITFYSASSDYSTPSDSSDDEFHSPTSGSPDSPSSDILNSLPPFLRSLAESSSSEKKPIDDFNSMMDEISRLLGKKGLNIKSNLSEKKREFTLSMHFKRDYRDSNSILVTTRCLTYGGLHYAVPMEIEINFADGSIEKFDYIFAFGAQIPLKDPVWENKIQRSWGGPQTMQEHRRLAVYSAFLRAYVFREVIKRAVHDDSQGLALRKLTSIYGNGKSRVDFTPQVVGGVGNFNKKKTADYAVLKKRDVDQIALGIDDNDPMPFVVYLKDKKFIKINERFMRIKNNQDLVKEKTFTAVDKIKSLNFILDNPMYAPEYSA